VWWSYAQPLLEARPIEPYGYSELGTRGLELPTPSLRVMTRLTKNSCKFDCCVEPKGREPAVNPLMHAVRRTSS